MGVFATGAFLKTQLIRVSFVFLGFSYKKGVLRGKLIFLNKTQQKNKRDVRALLELRGEKKVLLWFFV